MQISEHHFASTQPMKPLPGQPLTTAASRQRVNDKRLQQFLYGAPDRTFTLVLRLLRLRMTVALWIPTLAGAVLGWWHTGHGNTLTLTLLFTSTLALVAGITLLNDNLDYRYAQKENDSRPAQALYATPYHLLLHGQLQSYQVSLCGYLLVLASLLGQLGLFFLVGWPVLFFYALTFLLLYTYAAPPVRYGYRGWGLGEIGVLLGYGILPLIGSYFIVGRTINWLPVWVSIPFGLLTVLIFVNYNLVHYRRDWLMRKRTLVVGLGPLRTFDLSALLTAVIYAVLLTIASLAHLPISTLVTLAVMPLALGSISRLRQEQPPVEDTVRLHRTTLHASIWTGILFCATLLADKVFS
ncbi:MAG: prenyltransferase [Caldilineaceae bacterium]|nr:prenyltransferase [Caldilineaceae bacterium]